MTKTTSISTRARSSFTAVSGTWGFRTNTTPSVVRIIWEERSTSAVVKACNSSIAPSIRWMKTKTRDASR